MQSWGRGLGREERSESLVASIAIYWQQSVDGELGGGYRHLNRLERVGVAADALAVLLVCRPTQTASDCGSTPRQSLRASQLSIVGCDWLFRNFRESLPLRRVENPVAQQVKTGTTKHGALYHFETIDVALSLAIVPF